MLSLLLLLEDEEDEARFLVSTRHSSRLTFASGIEGAAEASRISVNFEVVIVIFAFSGSGNVKLSDR